MDRVRQWLKLDELLEKERQVGFHVLVLHFIFDCDISEKVTKSFIGIATWVKGTFIRESKN